MNSIVKAPPVLCILICTLSEPRIRHGKPHGGPKDLRRLFNALEKQRLDAGLLDKVKFIVNYDNGEKSTGAKRNQLLDLAIGLKSKGVAFFDDDDMPGPNYLKLQTQGIEEGYDVCSLWGQIYFNEVAGKPFHHSLKYTEWWEDEKYYYRCPNHLNAMNLDKIKDVRFQDKVFGEDGNWSMDIMKAGLLKTQFEIEEIIYHYYA